jgi:ribonuclease HII
MNSELFDFDAEYRQSGFRRLCGVDEAGRGPLAGPVVAAAVILPEHCAIEGINDSKKLTEKKREKLYLVIREKALAFGIGCVDAPEIDEINILQAAFKAMALAVEQLNPSPDYLLIDGRDFPLFVTKKDEKQLAGKAVIKGDGKSASIAAASILAKVYRDHLMIDYGKKFPQYGFEKHKGYGTKMHREQIKRHGICAIHRKSFLKKII